MADMSGTTTVATSQQELFAFLSDVGNLPRYFAKITTASPGDGEEVHTTATLSDGTKVEGKAWFRVDDASHSITWGSEGENDYHGRLEVTGKDAGSQVEVHIHTSRVEDGNEEIRDGIDRTLATIKLLVEKQNVA